jgi:hypothetical protein
MRVFTLASGGLEYGKPRRPVFGWAVDEPMVCAGIDPASSMFRAFCRRHCIRDDSSFFGLYRPRATARSSNPKAGLAVGGVLDGKISNVRSSSSSELTQFLISVIVSAGPL